MARTHRRAELAHPDVADIDLLAVLHALADPTRMVIVQTLRGEHERLCGTFPVDVAPSTLSHHFRVLREAGIIRQRDDANRRWTSLRRDDLDTRFPGLLDHITDSYTPRPARRTRRPGAQNGGNGREPG